jgi:AcrR family transcriptional regulator
MATSPEKQSATRTKILDAGIAIWRDQATSVLINGFTVARIAATAGVTRSTFYSYWPSTEDYVADLVTHLIDLDATNYPSIVANLTEGRGTRLANTDLPQAIVASCRAHFEVAVNDETFGLRLGFLSKADDPSIAAPLRELYRHAERSQYAPFLLSLESWGRALRDPIDESMMQIIFSSLLEGLAARYRVDPEAFPIDLYGIALLPLLVTLTRRPEDNRDLYEIVDSLNSWPAVGLSSKLRERETASDQGSAAIAGTSMREVTIAIRRLLARIGFGELSMSEIAAVTGYSESTLQQMFGSRPGIAMCLLFINCYERYHTVDPNLCGMTLVRAFIDINTDEIRRNPVIAQNMMLLLSGHTAQPRYELIDFDSRPIFDAAVKDAFDRGELSSDLEPKQFSMVLQRTLLIEAGPLAAATPEIDAVELLLQAAGAPPREGALDGTTVWVS